MRSRQVEPQMHGIRHCEREAIHGAAVIASAAKQSKEQQERKLDCSSLALLAMTKKTKLRDLAA
jgi:hypothetical protein